MNTKFKPLGLVVAVAAATAGYANIANAVQLAGNSDLGNLALIPYYTVRDGNVTGVHITNTSNSTQVVKVRLRRGTDSMDALDFNLILSPSDVWTGFLAAEGDNVVFNTTDNSCTAPAAVGGKFVMPAIYREDADEGYIEIIGMGETLNELQPIAVAAKHGASGVPASCAFVRDNFFANGSTTPDLVRGVVTSGQTVGRQAAVTPGGLPTLAPSNYVEPSNALKVSYFIRDAAGGREFGNSATHIADFLDAPAITNQQTGLFSGDLQGFDYPDLNGGSPNDVGARGAFTILRGLLGGGSVINDWSANADLNVGTDWVITFPGQYTMLNLPQYFNSLSSATATCPKGPAKPAGTASTATSGCDHRDIPAEATFVVFDREEGQLSDAEGELVVSPALPGATPRVLLPFEVNVVEWGVESVLGSQNSPVTVATPGAFGWAELSVVSDPSPTKVLAICDAGPTSSGKNMAESGGVTAAITAYGCTSGVAADQIPMIGFVAWERSFPGNPDANYGRIVEHSYGS